jgi:uncharacterized iron-regulated membrane protein
MNKHDTKTLCIVLFTFMKKILATLCRRQSWRKVHLYIALITSLPLLLIAVTGIILAFDMYIRALINPQTVANPNKLPQLTMEVIIAQAQKAHPDLALHMVVAPKSAWHSYLIYASKQEGKKRPFYRLYINPYDSDITAIQNRPTLPLTFIKRLHRNLLLGQPGRYFIAANSIALMVVCLVGVYLWWPMRKKTVTRALKKKHRLSMHNLLGLVALPLLLLIAFTGITVTFKKVIIPFIFAITHSPDPALEPKSKHKVSSPVIAAQVLKDARERFPNSTISSISLPKANTLKTYTVQVSEPFDAHPMGWVKLFYDGNTGEFIAHQDISKQSIAAQYNRLWYPLHTGEIFGFFGAVIWALVCGFLIYLIYSGFLLWNKRRKHLA